MRNVIIAGFILLFLLHQDFWLWEDRSLVWGFMPSGLAYHMLFSVASSALWALAVWLAWPADLEEAVLEEVQQQKEEQTEGAHHP